MIRRILFATVLIVSFSQAEMVKVTESVAITKPYTKKVKTGERCYEQTIEQWVSCGGQDENTIGLDTILGAAIGVAVGSQVGKGSGKDAARVLGGLGGGYIANQHRNAGKCKTYNQVTKCDPVYEYITEERIVGYRNCAYYKGQKVCKETKTPLEYLNITQKIYVH